MAITQSWVAATSQHSCLQNVFPVAVFDISRVCHRHRCSSNRLPSGKGSFLTQDKHFPPPWERERVKLKYGFLIPFQQGEQNSTQAAVTCPSGLADGFSRECSQMNNVGLRTEAKPHTEAEPSVLKVKKKATRKILKGTFYISMTIIINTCLWSSIFITRKEVINMKTHVKRFSKAASGRSSNRK